MLKLLILVFFFVSDSVPDRYKTEVMCDRVFSEDTVMIKYCLDRYKTQNMSHEAVYDCLSALKFASD